MARTFVDGLAGKLFRGGCRLGAGALCGLLILCGTRCAQSQGLRPQEYRGGVTTRSLVVEAVDTSRRVTIPGNVPVDATVENDQGPVSDAMPMEHMQMVLQRPAELEAELEKRIDAMGRKGSPEYHKWLTAAQFGARYGVSQNDILRISQWLESAGFRVDSVSPSGMFLEFSGTAGMVKQAFHAPIHTVLVGGTAHIANLNDPEIPAALKDVVKGVPLHNFMPHSMMKKHADYTFTDPTYGLFYGFVPGDMNTIYNLTPVLAGGVTGAGQTVVVVEDTLLLNVSDVSTFRTAFGLSGYPGTFSQITPTGPTTCTNSGVNSDEGEAALDAEWAGASAPGAAVVLASCSDTSTVFGGLIALQNLEDSLTVPPIVSVSYGQCESENGAAANQSYSYAFEQAAAEGISVFVSAGDEGAASCDANRTRATHGIAVSGFASTPYNVAVGGTDFGDFYASQQTNGLPQSTYWSASNNSSFASALSYIPEIPWNDSCASALIYGLEGYTQGYGTSGFCNSTVGKADYRTTAAGSGGPSSFSSQPSWQTGVVGLPTSMGGPRYLPDVSLFAANGEFGHFLEYCLTDTAQGGGPCDYTNTTDALDLAAGGTSFSSPMLAGIQALVNESQGSTEGNPNPRYYDLAGLEYGASGSGACNSQQGAGIGSNCVFYDVTLGDIDVNCTGPNCFGAVGTTTQGVLSTSLTALQPAYGTTTGWDFATGLGTLNVANLVSYWSAVPTGTVVSASQNPVQTGSSVTLTATVTPAVGVANNGTVTWSSNTGCAPSAVVNGVATCKTSALGAGYQTVTANSSFTCMVPGSSVYCQLGPSGGSLSEGIGVPATQLSVIAATSVRSGVSFPVTVAAQDSQGQTVPYYTGSVVLTSSDPNAVLPGSRAVLNNGIGTLTVTLKTGGVQTLTATDSSAPALTGSTNVTVDVGSLWTANNGNSSISSFDLLGAAYSGANGFTSAGLANPLGIAMDSAANVWVTGQQGVSEFDYQGNPLNSAAYAGGGLTAPAGIAIDGKGYVWVANETGPVSVLAANGSAVSPASGYQGANSSPLGAITIDISGDVWVTEPATNSVIELLGAGTPVAALANAAASGTPAGKP